MSKPKSSKFATNPDFGPRLAAQLNAELALMALPGRVLRIASLGRAVFTTSLGLEDQVLTSVIAATRADMRIVTLDTGRLFAETEALIGETEARYDLSNRGVQTLEGRGRRLMSRSTA
jgi:phosphoadenosine phosphosulfate reductase